MYFGTPSVLDLVSSTYGSVSHEHSALLVILLLPNCSLLPISQQLVLLHFSVPFDVWRPRYLVLDLVSCPTQSIGQLAARGLVQKSNRMGNNQLLHVVLHCKHNRVLSGVQATSSSQQVRFTATRVVYD